MHLIGYWRSCETYLKQEINRFSWNDISKFLVVNLFKFGRPTKLLNFFKLIRSIFFLFNLKFILNEIWFMNFLNQPIKSY